MKKNAKKLQKNLHISKKSCTFAPNLKNNKINNAKKQTIMKANELNKMLVKLAVISQKSLFRQRVRESIKKGEPYMQLALNA